MAAQTGPMMKRMKLPRIPPATDILNAQYTKDNMRSYAHRAMHYEREALAEFFEENNQLFTGDYIAKLIRERGQK
jgi:hypothetical protein